MRFHFKSTASGDAELNLIPLIDVLLVVLIFFMMESTFDKQQGVDVELPSAAASQTQRQQATVTVSITAEGAYHVNGKIIAPNDMAEVLRSAAAGKELDIVCRADKNARHQFVISFMKLAGDAGFSKISFATTE